MAAITTSKEEFTNAEMEPKDFSQSGVVTIIVGKKRKKFEIHKNLLVANSEYFKKIFAAASDWTEAQTNEVAWPEVNAEREITAIEIWVNWLYGRPIKKCDTFQLLDCYYLGRLRGMHRFENDVVDALRMKYKQERCFAGPQILMGCYQIDLRGTQIYHLLMQSWVRKIMDNSVKSDTFDSVRDDFQKFLAIDVLAQDFGRYILDYKAKPWAEPTMLKGCHFHDHSDGSSCSFQITT